MPVMEMALERDLAELRDALKSDSRILRLERLEKEICSSPEVIALAKKKDAAEEAYSNALSYLKPSSSEALRLQKALYEAKLTLDEHPLSKEYTEAFLAVRDLYMHIDDILYGDFRKKSLWEGLE
jgi:hypothetical protein